MNPLCCIAPVSLDRGGEHGNVAPAAAALKPRAPPGAQIPVRSSLSSKQLAAAAGACPAASPAAESAESAACREAAAAAAGEVKGKGDAAVAGVLYKWVNYGKGWRSRWFVLEDGVLSYYKVHGPDKILVGPACEAGGVRVIGEDSLRRVRKDQLMGGAAAAAAAARGSGNQGKPFGEIHLKVRNLHFSSLCFSTCEMYVA